MVLTLILFLFLDYLALNYNANDAPIDAVLKWSVQRTQCNE